jgi:EAL domain-containing protein (putative c-di-GMP-specific phosphodiesterase class I)
VAESARAALDLADPVQLSAASDLDAALDAGLLTVAYQPVISLKSGAVVAAEALARLRTRDHGPLRPPDTFVPLAEATGRIGRIDRLVLAQAVPQAVAWRALLPGRPFSVGINLSVASLSDPSIVDVIRHTCASFGLPCNALVIEVTETVLSTQPADAEVLSRIAALGCNVTLDDFGTGYSSLRHLSRFPVSGVKIDRDFVWDIGTAGRGGRVPGALVRLGLDLGLHVVAEGVETPAQLAALRAAGCPYAQGYLISRPVPAEELTRLLVRDGGGIPLPRAEQPS